MGNRRENPASAVKFLVRGRHRLLTGKQQRGEQHDHKAFSHGARASATSRPQKG